MYDIIKVILPYCANEKEFQSYLQSKGINVEFKLKRTTGEIEGISFNYDNVSFKGSEVDRKFSYGNLKKEFEKNILESERQKQFEFQRERQQVSQQQNSPPPKESWSDPRLPKPKKKQENIKISQKGKGPKI